jgi:hypothetical protein
MDVMSEYDISEVGASLVAHSQEQEISGRGLVNSLFPYIYTASKRMSTRAISAFLQEQHGVKLSAVTIAKALREPERHALGILERVEPAARTVAAALDVSPESLLEDPNCFEAMKDKPPGIWPGSREETAEALAEYDAACDCLETEWFALPSDLRLMTLGVLKKQERKEDASDAK